MAKKVSKQKKDTPPKICYFCLWNDPVMEIHKGVQVLPACRYCYNTMQPLVNSKDGVWGWTLASLRPIDPEMDKLHNMPFLKCPNCRFRSIYQESLTDHQKYTHRPGHDFPPNVVPEIEKQDWVNKLGHRW